MLLLELFKGTGSVGKVAKELGIEVISVDIDEKFKPDIKSDILKWNYKEVNFIPDFIWASFPCDTFSAFNYFRMPGDRDPKTGEPYSDRAKHGTRILKRSLTIINYFRKLNPNLKFCLENPVGMARKTKELKKYYRETTSYNQWGDRFKRYKPTDFWSNFILNLKPVKRSKETISIKTLKLTERYAIPPKLINHILTQSIKETIIKRPILGSGNGDSHDLDYLDYYKTIEETKVC